MTCDILIRLIEIAAEVQPAISDKDKQEIEQRITAEFSGESLYIRKTPSNRKLSIQRKFTGSNVNELAKEFGVSVRAIYKNLKKK